MYSSCRLISCILIFPFSERAAQTQQLCVYSQSSEHTTETAVQVRHSTDGQMCQIITFALCLRVLILLGTFKPSERHRIIQKFKTCFLKWINAAKM